MSNEEKMDMKQDRETMMKNDHCEIIYCDLVKTTNLPFFKDDQNKSTIMSQLKEQMDYIYSRRYGKKRIG